jgi:predicted Fe-Mo cluster-binding NifX family protein
MKVGIPTWSGTISPVFDVAQRLLLVDVETARGLHRCEEALNETDIAARAMHVARLGVDVLICGAISRPLEMMLVAEEVEVIPHACGPVEDVLRAYVSGQLTDEAFLMPGCCGRRRRLRARAKRGRTGFERQGGES